MTHASHGHLWTLIVKYMSENIDDIETLPTHLIQRSTLGNKRHLYILRNEGFKKIHENDVSNPPTNSVVGRTLPFRHMVLPKLAIASSSRRGWAEPGETT